MTPPDSPVRSAEDSAAKSSPTRQANGVPPRRAIYRVPKNTWDFLIRKYEVPRKTLHVSIGPPPAPKTNGRVSVPVFVQVRVPTE
jgi:hypothetical protein